MTTTLPCALRSVRNRMPHAPSRGRHWVTHGLRVPALGTTRTTQRPIAELVPARASGSSGSERPSAGPILHEETVGGNVRHPPTNRRQGRPPHPSEERARQTGAPYGSKQTSALASVSAMDAVRELLRRVVDEKSSAPCSRARGFSGCSRRR